MCVYFRYLCIFATLINILGVFYYYCIVKYLQVMIIAMAFVFSAFQFSVENKWVNLPSFCLKSSVMSKISDKNLTTMQKAEIIRQNILKTEHAKCDEIKWKVLGLSVIFWGSLYLLLLLIIYFGAVQCKNKQ